MSGSYVFMVGINHDPKVSLDLNMGFSPVASRVGSGYGETPVGRR